MHILHIFVCILALIGLPAQAAQGASKAGKALQTIPDLLSHGYVITQSSTITLATGYKNYIYKITHPDVTMAKVPMTLDQFVVSDDPASAGRIIVTDAWNMLFDHRPKEVKLSLRGLILGFGKHIKQNPRNLRQIYYKTVIEVDLKDLTPTIFTVLGRPAKSTTIQRGAQKMVEEYRELAGMRIKNFEYIVKGVDPDDGELKFDFAVNLELTT